MADHVATSSRDEDVTSMTSSQPNQPFWMSQWSNRSSKPNPKVDDSAMICYKEGHVDMRGHLMQSALKAETSLQYGKGVNNSAGTLDPNSNKKPGNHENRLSYSYFPSLSLCQNKGNVSTVGIQADHGTQADHECGHKSMALALAPGKDSTSRDFNLRSREQQARSHLYQEQKGKAVSRSSTYNKSNASKPVRVFEKHFSNDNFTCFSQDRCKYQKSSSVLFHEKKMENNICDESGFCDGSHLQHGCSPGKKNIQLFNRFPCSFHNVETMRICTMVDSMENTPGHPPKISQRAHHILFTKETCVNLSKGHHLVGEPTIAHPEGQTFGESFSIHPNLAFQSRGVKIQPLWSSTDSEGKETTGNPSTSKADSWNEASAETDDMHVESTFVHRGGMKNFGGVFSMSPKVDSRSRGVKIQPLPTPTDSEEKENRGDHSFCRAGAKNGACSETGRMQVEAPKHQCILSGMESSPTTKDDTVDENSPPAAYNSSTERAISKRPITEIPDINVELPEIQPEISSTDGKEPSTSRVHSLNAKQLFSCNEQTSRSECNARQERSPALDANSRWIKRLKVSSSDSYGVGTKSSDMGEGSSHEKFNTFFNRIMKCNRATSDTKHHGKVHMAIEQNVESLRSGGSSSTGSKKKNQSMTHGCSWIQRWCQSYIAPPPSNPEPLVICEPHSLKFGQNEVAKKQFPSIAAMALMGKAMNGFRSCEFKKRGPVVLWNTKDY